MDTEAVIRIPRQPAATFVLRVADAVGTHAAASAAFAPPVAQNGTTVIPVALSMWGFGAGRGRKQPPDAPVESGLGGGGGAVVRPMGYLVMRGGDVSYRPITAAPALLLAGVAGAAIGALAARRRRAAAHRPAYEW